MKFYMAIKKKEHIPFVTAQMDLGNIMLSKISHSEKDKYHINLTHNVEYNEPNKLMNKVKSEE